MKKLEVVETLLKVGLPLLLAQPAPRLGEEDLDLPCSCPSGIPGSRHMEEVTVKLCSLIKAQKATADPALLTENMQV